MDYETIKRGLSAAIPLVRTLGLEYVELGPDGATVRLPERPEILNHVGSQHAGALFTVAEAASGAAFVSGFAEKLAEITPLARSASIDYEKLATGTIDAKAVVEDVEELLSSLEVDGKVEFTIEVELFDQGGQRVATAAVDWHVRSKND